MLKTNHSSSDTLVQHLGKPHVSLYHNYYTLPRAKPLLFSLLFIIHRNIIKKQSHKGAYKRKQVNKIIKTMHITI